jgi:ribonuclease HI
MDRNTLYREVGEALHLAQALEFNISTLISIMNRHYQAHIEGAPLIVGDDRRPLGQLIREIQKQAKIDQAGIDALSEALEARNYVAHHFFIRNIAALTDSSLCSEAITALKKRAKQIAIGTAITSGFVQGFCEALKIKQSDVLIEQDI